MVVNIEDAKKDKKPFDRGIEKFYEKNEDFKNYVEGYCKKHRVNKEVAFAHSLVRITYEYYKQVSEDKNIES